MRTQWVEAGLGAVVLLIAAAFLVYSLGVAGPSHRGGGYALTARFGEVGSLAAGASVRVAGVKVGTVERVELDPKTFLAVARLNLDADVRLPADSTAKITSDGLLGGAHVAITPGGDPADLKAGGEIENTQGAVDLFGLIGQVMRPQAGAQTAPPAEPAPAPAAQ